MGIAGGGILVLAELRFDGGTAETLAPPFQMLVEHGFRDAQARHDLAFGGMVRVTSCSAAREHTIQPAEAGRGVVDAAGDATFRITGEHERVVCRGAQGRGPDVAARSAQSLHGCERDHGPRPFVARGGAACAAHASEAPRREHGLLRRPFACQSPYLSGGDAGFSFGPLRRLGEAVRFAEHVVRPL